MLTSVLFLVTPIALVVAVVSRLLGGRAWSPAVTVVMATIAVFLGAVLAGMAVSLLG